MTVEPTEISNARLSSEPAARPAEYKKPAYVFLALLVMYSIARGIRGAAALPFWWDEFFTLTIAGQPTVHDMLAILRKGFDVQPLLFYLIERPTLYIPIKKEVALRLPSILAFPCILICVFEYVRRRSGELIACLCAFLLLSTSIFHTHLIDARPYCMEIACLAFAVLSYQHLPSPRWTALFALSLVTAGSLHYYAVCSMMAFWLAEGVFFLRTRRFRWPVWLALVCGVLPVISSLSLLLRAKAFYGPHYFAPANLSRVFGFYGTFFATDRASGLALVVVSVTAIAWWMVGAKMKVSRNSGDGDPVEQGTLLLGLNLIPFFTFVVARIGHGQLLERYALLTTIGLVVGFSCALSVIRSNAAMAFLGLFLLTIVGLHEKSFWHWSGQDSLTFDRFSASSTSELAQIQALVQKAGHLDLPVVVDNAAFYFQMVYYSPPDFTNRLLYLTDERREVDDEGTDAAVKAFKAFHDYFPLRLADYTGFATRHPEFLLYSDPQRWILAAMRREGATVQVLETAGARTVYLVKMRGASPQ